MLCRTPSTERDFCSPLVLGGFLCSHPQHKRTWTHHHRRLVRLVHPVAFATCPGCLTLLLLRLFVCEQVRAPAAMEWRELQRLARKHPTKGSGRKEGVKASLVCRLIRAVATNNTTVCVCVCVCVCSYGNCAISSTATREMAVQSCCRRARAICSRSVN